MNKQMSEKLTTLENQPPGIYLCEHVQNGFTVYMEWDGEWLTDANETQSDPVDYTNFVRHDASSATDLDAARARIAELESQLVKEGPLNTERCTLDELLEVLDRWKAVAGGSTCVSFQNLCYGASSLWHQTHRENFRKVDRKPEALSRWVLDHAGAVNHDFPDQVLSILVSLKEQLTSAKQRVAELEGLRVLLAEFGAADIALESDDTGDDVAQVDRHVEAYEAIKVESRSLAAARQSQEKT